MLHKAIKGFEEYLITDTGRIYSLKSGKYLKSCPQTNGYLMVVLSKNYKKYDKTVHRLVAEAFIPNTENKPTVDHINRIRDDNRACNLSWDSHSEQAINRNNLKQTTLMKEKYGQAIIEVINDEVSIAYLSLREVPNISHNPISRHINKGETDFTIKQRNGNVRHFKIPKQK